MSSSAALIDQMLIETDRQTPRLPSPTSKHNAHTHSVAHAAARAGRADLLQLLAEAELPGLCDLSEPNALGETPLQAALAAGQELAALLLLAVSGGGSSDPSSLPAASATPPLVLAAAGGMSDVVRVLLAQAKDKGQDPAALLAAARDGTHHNRTALHAASAGGHRQLACRLARTWPEGLFVKDREGRVPAAVATAEGHAALAAALERPMQEQRRPVGAM